MEQSYPTPSAEAPNNKKYLFIGLFLVVIVMFLATITFIISNASSLGNKTEAQNTGGTNSALPSQTPNSSTPVAAGSTSAAPKVEFSNWIFSSHTSVTPPASAAVYDLKQNYSQAEISQLAKQLSAGNIFKSDKDQSLGYMVDQAKHSVNALFFNSKTGSFSYISNQGIPLDSTSITTSATIDDKVYAFLKANQLYDPTIKITAHYKRKDKPDTSYIELHRDWQQAGLPILNFLGTINLPENTNLDSVNLLSPKSTVRPNDTIYATTDNTDGFERADDFNTMTIVLDDTNKIIGIRSSIRLIKDTAKTATLLSTAAVQNKLKNNQYDYIFTSPSGTGSPSWTKIYPNNIAQADQVIVSDQRYVYLEDMPDHAQPQLKPYVLVRGNATLKSGYSVNFIAAVQADASTLAYANNGQQVLGASTTRYLAQTNPEVTPTPRSPGLQGGELTQTPNNNTPTPPQSTQCLPDAGMLSPRFSLTFNGTTVTLGYTTRRWGYHGGQWVENEQPDPRWYWVPPDNFSTVNPTAQVDKLKQDYDIVMANLHAFDTAAITNSPTRTGLYTTGCKTEGCDPESTHTYRPWDLILKDLTARVSNGLSSNCPINFTGMSPSLFIYGKDGQVVTIRPNVQLTYADPAMENNSWDVVIHSNGLTVNDSQRSYIYYEYLDQHFAKPNSGWTVQKNQLDSFITTTSDKLKLNDKEKARLSFELHNVADSLQATNLFIGLINQEEVNQKIPLNISPQPTNIQRYHFYIAAANNTSYVAAPALKPVMRTPYMVLEFGAVPGM